LSFTESSLNQTFVAVSTIMPPNGMVSSSSRAHCSSRHGRANQLTIGRAGDYYKVEPGKWHQFIGVDDGVAFELYWAEFDPNDIVRRTTGKVLETPPTEDHVGNPIADLNAN
jgi:hypothetical protein